MATLTVLIFTDLDGTLLDHADYSFEAAKPSLALIRERKIPLIFTTSKTRAEIERLQQVLQVDGPFIAENGAALFFPEDYRGFKLDGGFSRPPYVLIELGAAYDEIRRFISPLRERFGVRGFGDLSLPEIQRLTGLSREQAALAAQREYTEPFIIGDQGRLDEMAAVAAARGLRITAGGRFLHLTGERQDKGRAVRLCAEIFAGNTGGAVATVGLGDSANDIPMLESVDIPVLIPHPDGSYEQIAIPNLLRAAQPGSRGWNQAVRIALTQIEERRTA